MKIKAENIISMAMKFDGFNRVLINEHGEAVSPRRANEMGIYPDLGFMRGDGWSLGAPKKLENVARSLWADEWTHLINFPQTEWKQYEQRKKIHR